MRSHENILSREKNSQHDAGNKSAVLGKVFLLREFRLLGALAPIGDEKIETA